MESTINSLDGKKVLITGGGGYLGSKLAEKLACLNNTVFLFDIKFNEFALDLSNKKNNVHLIEIDLTDKKAVNIGCAEINPDVIFHFAALLNRERDFNIFPTLYKINVTGTLNLLEGLKNSYYGFYFASSSEVYGYKNSCPFEEEQIPAPVSPYSLTKLMAEQLIQTYSDINNKPYTILRIFNFYGPGMSDKFFINQLISTLLKNETFRMTQGEQLRDFLYIDDLIRAIEILSTENHTNTKRTLNISSGIGIHLWKVAALGAKLLNKDKNLNIGAIPYRDNEIWEMFGSNEKIKKILNWQPDVSLEDGLKKTIDWEKDKK